MVEFLGRVVMGVLVLLMVIVVVVELVLWCNEIDHATRALIPRRVHAPFAVMVAQSGSPMIVAKVRHGKSTEEKRWK
jgi:hypothetical protein